MFQFLLEGNRKLVVLLVFVLMDTITMYTA